MIVDANDLGQELLGYSDVITESEEELLGMIKDNPAGQGKQTTPIILIRKNQVAKHHFNDSNFTIINHENLIEQVDMYKIVDFNLPKSKIS